MAEHNWRVKTNHEVNFRWTQLPTTLSLYGEFPDSHDSDRRICSLKISRDREITFLDSTGVKVDIDQSLSIKDLFNSEGKFPDEIQEMMSPSLNVRIREHDGQVYIANMGSHICVSGLRNATRKGLPLGGVPARVRSQSDSIDSVFSEKKASECVYRAVYGGRQTMYCKHPRPLKP